MLSGAIWIIFKPNFPWLPLTIVLEDPFHLHVLGEAKVVVGVAGEEVELIFLFLSHDTSYYKNKVTLFPDFMGYLKLIIKKNCLLKMGRLAS